MSKTVVSIINKSFENNSSNNALITEDGTCLTYAQVRERASRLANYLEQKGVRAGSLVAILMDRSTDFIIATVACMLHGYGFIPLDTEYPAERIETIKKDAQPSFVITEFDFIESLKYEPVATVADVSEDATAYVVFTSGSTGKPKGIVHDQLSLASAIERNQKAFKLEKDDIWGVAAPFTFVAFVPEVISTLASGSAVTVIPREIVKDPEVLSGYLAEKKITVTFIAPRALKLFKKTGSSLRTVITGGERISNIAPDGFKLIAGYGQSETCGPSVWMDVDRPYETTPVGNTVGDNALYLLDENNKEAEEGEICLSGHFMTKYMNLPQQTEQTLKSNPFIDRDGNEKILHTGDLGKRLPNGDVVYVNRKDWMIKINGQRVEPGEIETVLRSIEGVLDAAVKSFVNRYNQTYICAYYVSKNEITSDDISSILQEKLPSYMVPSFFVKLEELPLNNNRKLDRNALQEPNASEFLTEYESPSNNLERTICDAFSKVLGLSKIGANDDFFKVGGDSIKAVMVAKECASIKLKVNHVYRGKTPKEIAKLISSDNSEIKIIKTDSNEMPLTDSQMGIYLDSSQENPDCRYNIPFVFTFDASVDSKKLKDSVERIIKNHQAFSIGIKVNDGIPVMTKTSEYPEIKIVQAKEDEFANLKTEFIKPFIFDGKPLYRVTVVKTEKHVYLLMDIHHLVFDGTSLDVFKKNLCNELEEKITPFMISAYEQESKGGEKEKENLKFYKELLAGCDVDPNLSPDVFNPQDSNLKSSYVSSIELDSRSVEFFTGSNGVTENTLFASAFAIALAKFTCQKESLFVSVENGRSQTEMENSVGMFVRSFPVYVNVDENSSTKDFLHYVQKTYFDCMTHDEVSFSDVVHDCGIDTSVRFVYQSELLSNFDYEGKRVDVEMLPVKEAMANLEMMVIKQNDSYKVSLGYRKSLYSAELIKSFVETYCLIVNGLCKKTLLKDINLLSKNQEKLLDEYNSNDIAYDENETPVDVLKKIVSTYPNNLAVCFKDKSLTYSQFDSITDNLASFIAKEKLGPESFIPVLTARSHLMPILAWGVVKSGMAYQPLDPSYPTERLNFMVKDCAAKLVIADRNLAGLLTEYKGNILYTDEIETLPQAESISNNSKPQDTLALLYTSGTTGTPKGIEITNANVRSFVINHLKNMDINSESRFANYAGFGFDACLMDIFSILMVGATLYVVPDEIRLDLNALEKFYIENKISHGFITTQLGCMFAQAIKSEYFKCLMVGGEKLIPFKPSEKFRVLNGYGPSETLAYVACYAVNNDGPIQPIGKANNNTKLYIADSYGRRLPIGACGELLIAGPQVSKGYLNRPEKTNEVFVSNCYSDNSKYGRIYKTGDVVRILPDGNYDFIGRRDGQVKIRGFRIELTEVEQIIRSFAGIKNATVQAFDNPSGGKFIAAYIVSDSKVSIEALNEYIGKEKPAYMIPSVTVQIDSIPMTPNGKVDKRKLPVPQWQAEEIVPPETETQKKILEEVCSVLGTEIGITTDVFAAGLSSLGIIRLNAQLSTMFNVAIQTRDLKANPTVKELEQFILSSTSEEKTTTVYPDYPLTKTQEGIFIECQSNLESTVYNIPYLLKIGKNIDIRRLKAAICETVEAHKYINTTLFYAQDGTVRQRLAPVGAFCTDDIQTLKFDDIEKNKISLVSPHKLLGGRLFRISIIETPEDLYLFMDFHHIICDGTSMTIFVSDIEQSYLGKSPLEESYSGYDVSLNEQKLRNSKSFIDAEDYYQNLLSGFDTDYLPKPDVHSYSNKGSGTFIFEGQSTAAEKIEQYCKKNNVSENGIISTAFGYVLSLFNGTESSVFTTVYNGRNDSRMGRTVSMLVKTLPVLFNPEKDEILQVAKKMSSQLMDSMSNDIYSFAEISKRFGMKSDVMLVFQGKGFEQSSFCGFDCKLIDLDFSDSKAPLSVEIVNEADDKYSYKLKYNTDLFTEEFVESFARVLDLTVSQFAECNKFEEISLVDEKTSILLNNYNSCETDYDKSMNCVDILKDVVKKYPDYEALRFKNDSYNFSQFDDLTDRLGSHLKSLGAGRGKFVAIITGRSQYMTISAWGVVKSGSAYLPIDPSYPRERIDMMIKDSEAGIIIVDRDLKDLISKDFVGKIVYLDEVEKLPSVKDFKVSINPEDPFIIIYSSGSTGVPKGSMLPHRSLVALQLHYDEVFLSSPAGQRTASYASFGFDAGIQDNFCTLMSGNALYIIPEEIRLDIPMMEKFFVDNKINSCFMTTQVAKPFLQNTKCKSLKAVQFGGEKMSSFTPPSWVQVVNGYGPSEANCYVTSYFVKDNNSVQPIGKQCINTKLYVVDKAGRMLPPGVCGELCIAGPQVALGYLNRPEKNAQSFVENPFCNDELYKTLYKTGDIARMLPDGNYDFVGRRDGQVKIRGFRIELGEVESVIASFPSVKQVTVQAFDAPTGGKYLAAYVVCDGELDCSNLADFIKKSKPSYMVPASIMKIDAIPLTVNGKVNKAKLPSPVVTSSANREEPKGELETKICNIFESLLGLDKVYADDDFFEIGGSSISALQLVVKCNNEDLKIVYKDIFENSTPRRLAAFINKDSKRKEVFAPGGEEASKYNYSALDFNTVSNLSKIRNDGIGNVLLTGSTGFLGIHVLRYLLKNTDSKIICLIRSKDGISVTERLKMLAVYYFEEDLAEYFESRIHIVDSSLSDPELTSKLEEVSFDTIINCAANVRHFGTEEALMRDNFLGIQTLIDLAMNRNAKLIQTSSVSVAGESLNGHIPMDFVFKENNLNIGQSLDNMYIRTKYMAEQAVIDAVSKGLRGKVVRFGNLMARSADGEFQVNASNSGFINNLNSFRVVGCYPTEALDTVVELTPIDCAAKTLVLLSGTPDEFTVFHVYNPHTIHMANILNVMNYLDLKIDYVSSETFSERLRNASQDESLAKSLSGIISYQSRSGENNVSKMGIGKDEENANDDSDFDVRTKVLYNNDYTVKALYRLGFSWPLMDNQYLYSLIKNLKDLGRFD